jgi:hypothetical protein
MISASLYTIPVEQPSGFQKNARGLLALASEVLLHGRRHRVPRRLKPIISMAV